MQNKTFLRLQSLLLDPRFAMLYFSLVVLSFFFVDRPVALWMEGYVNTPLTHIAEIITTLGLAKYYFAVMVVVLLMAYFLKRRDWIQNAFFVALSVGISGILCDVIKILLSRSRPNAFFEDHLYGFYFLQKTSLMHSFPSGHSSNIGALMMSLSLIKPRFWPIFMCVGILVCCSRVVLTAHFVSDVMVGFYLGSVISVWMFKNYFNLQFNLLKAKGFC